jgi:hypothetical protein
LKEYFVSCYFISLVGTGTKNLLLARRNDDDDNDTSRQCDVAFPKHGKQGTETVDAYIPFPPLFSLVYCNGGKLSAGRHRGLWQGWNYMWLVFAF